MKLSVIKIVFSLFSILCFACHSPSEHPISNKKSKDQLIATAKKIYEKGLTAGTGGDISVRIDSSDQFIIKATGYCLGNLDYNSLSTLNTNGELLNGNPYPSSEAHIHTSLYKMKPEIHAIMHIHAPYATAWATTGQTIPKITQQSYKILAHCGIVPYHPPKSIELRDTIIACYKDPETTVVLMENHGFFIIGKDLNDLLYKAEVVENTAKIAYLCKTLGYPVPFIYKDY